MVLAAASMRYEPSDLEAEDWLYTFNAGVNGIGGTADAGDDRVHPRRVARRGSAYLWRLDVEGSRR